ncbi:MAG: hypothetical protein HYY17_15670 [Planctomycetes bacterium]|nr:hypothetical protein [Planctomycetota bacterium]
MTSIRKIAEELKLDFTLVRDVLKEVSTRKVAKSVQDRIFNAARRFGYDLNKLRIGKRMAHQRETLEDVLKRVEANPGWGRDEIVRHLREALGMVERVQKRVFKDEYGDEWL